MSSNLANYLLVPGLLGDLPRLSELGELPRFPNLELLLSRAERQSAPVGYAETLFELFGLPIGGDGDVPTAALCYHAETGVEPLPKTYLMHADPVHLRPDQDRLLAFDFHHQPLTADEARQYAQAFNAHFANDGLRLLTPHPTRWYLALAQAPALRTRPLADVLGRNIDLFLPEGEDSAQWRSWMNELQMLFYTLPVNQTREAMGQLAVSGLWFSGGGVLPEQSLSGFSQMAGSCVLLDALQSHAQSQEARSICLQQAPGRAVLDANAERWLSAVAELDQQLAPLIGSDLYLYACDGERWIWRPSMRRHLWKRRKPFGRWLRDTNRQASAHAIQ